MQARADGFEHLVARWDTPETVLPISMGYAMPPRTGCYAGPLGTWSWDETVAAFRAAPGALLEPHPCGCVDSDEAIAAVRRWRSSTSTSTCAPSTGSTTPAATPSTSPPTSARCCESGGERPAARPTVRSRR